LIYQTKGDQSYEVYSFWNENNYKV